jgi:hypothetical protein
MGFVQSSTDATGLAGSKTIYTIDIDSESASTLKNEFDYHPK